MFYRHVSWRLPPQILTHPSHPIRYPPPTSSCQLSTFSSPPQTSPTHTTPLSLLVFSSSPSTVSASILRIVAGLRSSAGSFFRSRIRSTHLCGSGRSSRPESFWECRSIWRPARMLSFTTRTLNAIMTPFAGFIKLCDHWLYVFSCSPFPLNHPPIFSQQFLRAYFHQHAPMQLS
jgi:hypothetical protein